MILACLAAAWWFARQAPWPFTGSVLLFLGLLTLINAPFDWASLGLTRALLRRGLELGNLYPYILALVDALLAVVIITVLTVFTVIGVQAFDDVAAHAAGDGARVLPLESLFDGIATNPAASEYWWVYATLLSTMIPSIVNLAIGGISLLRGIPWLTTLLLRLMPEDDAPPLLDQTRITLLLTLQVFVGLAIGIMAQGFLFYLVFWWVLPAFEVDLLYIARTVAAPDLPGQAIAVIARLL
jgi:hypothetical protein